MAKPFLLHILFHFILLPTLFLYALARHKGFSLKLIPARFSLNWEENLHNKTFEFSTESSLELDDPNNIYLKVHPSEWLYYVEVPVGTLPTTVGMLLDTGSGFIWSLCKPCASCSSQTIPFFDPRSSSTYRKVPRTNCPTGRQFRWENGECVYTMTYGGGKAGTKGVVATEKYTFPYERSRSLPISATIFGCSDDATGFDVSKLKASGIMGLNRSPTSLVTQRSDRVQGRFMYCLLYMYSGVEATSTLRFGQDATFPRTSEVIKSTPMLRPSTSSYYYFLSLIDISVGSRRLGFSPGTFDIKPSGTAGGCVIDSGAGHTRIAEGAFKTVMDEFDRQYKSLGLKKLTRKYGGFVSCYDIPNGGFNSYIPMTFHFQGADYVVDAKYNYIRYPDQVPQRFCVPLKPGTTRALFGAWHQQDMRILYDINAAEVKFQKADCSHDSPIDE